MTHGVLNKFFSTGSLFNRPRRHASMRRLRHVCSFNFSDFFLKNTSLSTVLSTTVFWRTFSSHISLQQFCRHFIIHNTSVLYSTTLLCKLWTSFLFQVFLNTFLRVLLRHVSATHFCSVLLGRTFLAQVVHHVYATGAPVLHGPRKM